MLRYLTTALLVAAIAAVGLAASPAMVGSEAFSKITKRQTRAKLRVYLQARVLTVHGAAKWTSGTIKLRWPTKGRLVFFRWRTNDKQRPHGRWKLEKRVIANWVTVAEGYSLWGGWPAGKAVSNWKSFWIRIPTSYMPGAYRMILNATSTYISYRRASNPVTVRILTSAQWGAEK